MFTIHSWKGPLFRIRLAPKIHRNMGSKTQLDNHAYTASEYKYKFSIFIAIVSAWAYLWRAIGTGLVSIEWGFETKWFMIPDCLRQFRWSTKKGFGIPIYFKLLVQGKMYYLHIYLYLYMCIINFRIYIYIYILFNMYLFIYIYICAMHVCI